MAEPTHTGADTPTARPRTRQRRPQFWQLSMRTCQVAAVVDVGFFFLFHILGSPILAWVNVISVGMYVAAYYALKHRHNQLAIGLIWVEVLVHAALGIVLIGWESGFHYFLLMFIPALCVAASRRQAVLLLLGLWAYYVALDVLMWFIDPLQPIHPAGLRVVHLFNLSVVFAMFSYLSFFYVRMVVNSQHKLHQLATTDPLTGLLNRRHMMELAEKELARFERSGRPLCFLLLDLDHFKQINDTYGHASGDRVLMAVADVLRQQLRKQDLIARWGGEEFLAVLPDTDLVSSHASAERIRQALIHCNWRQLTDTGLQVTVSIGVSELHRGESLDSAINRADHALYVGKVGGRNRVEIASPS